MKEFSKYFELSLISVLMLVILLLVGVAYLTLLERKFLGYLQNRKGPNKVGFEGLMQPFAEMVKLFSKEMVLIMKSSYFIYYLMPLVSMFLMLMVWLNFVYFTNIYFLSYSILIIILILSLNSYMIMLMGWSSNSLYAMIGSIRSIVQVVSYEVSFVMIIFVQMFLSESYSLMDLFKWQIKMVNIFMLNFLGVVFFISVLAELNRSPMDFIEGESELVSGFNVEYFGGGFSIIFLSEYGMIIFMSYLVSCLYMGVSNMMMFMGFCLIFIILVVIVRGVLPRMRYDELMYLCWKIILPIVLMYFCVFMCMKNMFSILI